MENLIEYNNSNIYFWSKVTPKDKAFFYEHLSNLVDWWVTVINSLSAFIDKSKKPVLAKEISNLLFFINSWDSFSVAMKKLPETFNRKEIAIIEAWESSWTIQKSFENLSKQIRDQEDLKSMAKWALTYPTIIMTFLIIAVFIIMTFVIPKIIPLFSTASVELPLITRALIFTSNTIINNKLLIIFSVIFIIFWFVIYSKSEHWKKYFDSLYLSIPIAWDVYKNFILAQIASNLGLLIWAWIPIIKTLRLTWEASNNNIYKIAIDIISEKVNSWKRITQSIEETDPKHIYFPNDFVQMISAWEKTSTINTVCFKIHKQYSKEVEHSVWVLIKWIEPIAILIAWIFVTWFAAAIFAAVIKITETV